MATSTTRCNCTLFLRLLFIFICCLLADAKVRHFHIDVFDEGQDKPSLDSKSNPGPDGTPWFLGPQCTRQSKSNKQYCLFTSETFAGGRGISIITSRKEAERLAKFAAFTDSNLHQSLGINHSEDPPFVVRSTKDRGIGVFANRTILKGEWLMVSTPAYMILGEAYSDLKPSALLELQQRAIQSLPQTLRSLVEDLSSRSKKSNNTIENIRDTNAFNTPISTPGAVPSDEGFNGTDYSVIFPEAARLNHHCRPNTRYTFDPRTLSKLIIASRNIFIGEEITTTYIDPIQEKKKRLEALSNSWGFDCKCSLCTAPSKVSRKSDQRIQRIIRLQDVVNDVAGYPEILKAPTAFADQMIHLYKQEHLWSELVETYFASAILCNAVGRPRRAQIYANMALESGYLCRGSELGNDMYRSLNLLSADPRRHYSRNSLLQKQ